jgi:hypothetical protein
MSDQKREDGAVSGTPTAAEAVKSALQAQNGFVARDGSVYMGSTGGVDCEALVAALSAAGFELIQLPAEDGLFASPVASVRFCGAAMGGHGSYSDLSEDEAVVELIAPASMVSGQSINSLNSPQGRKAFAAALLTAAVVGSPEPAGKEQK